MRKLSAAETQGDMTKSVRRLIGSLAESPQVRDSAMLCALKCVNCQQ